MRTLDETTPMRTPSLRFCLALCALLFGAALAGCSPLSLGTCSSNADCKSGSTCDFGQSPAVCVINAGACFPACPDGRTCQDGVCVGVICAPACTPGTQTCNPVDGGCITVTEPVITVTSPAAGSFAGAQLQATADAVAPGGVSALKFEVHQNSTVVAQGTGAAHPTGSDPSNWSGIADLSALDGGSDGPAFLYAVATLDGGVHALSPPVAITIDRTGPELLALSDGRTSFYSGGATAQVQIQVKDTGAGIAPGAQATLAFIGVTHAPTTATVSDAGIASFAIALDDVLGPPSANTTVAFSVSSTDAVGNSSTLVGNAKEVLQIDRLPPSGMVDANPGWHSQAEQVVVTGTISDPGGSITGGQSAVVLSHAGTTLATATIAVGAGLITNGTWSATIDLSAQTFPFGFEGAWTLTATLTDAAGNSATAAGALLVDASAPQISNVQLLTASRHDGGIYDTDAGPLAFSAQISDATGVARARFSYQGQSPIAGTSSDGGFWLFTVPAPIGNYDNQALAFTLSADDLFADGGAPGSAGALHRAAANGSTLFDNTPPQLTISSASDAGWYVRNLPAGGAAMLEIDVAISDGSGVADGGAAPKMVINGNNSSPVAPTANNGSAYVFFLDATLAQSGQASALNFVVTAQDLLGNSRSAAGSRNIDDVPPSITGLQIYRSSDAPPGGGVVGYPTQQQGTGHDGTAFIFNDPLTVGGTVNEQGAGTLTLNVQVNGAQTDGGTTTGQAIALASSDAGTFDFAQAVQLNDPRSGAFNMRLADIGQPGFPTGTMSIALRVEDAAMLPDGGPAHHGSSTNTSVNVTRFLWQSGLTGLVNTHNTYSPGIAGFALHPSGALIVTGAASNNSVNANLVWALDTNDNGNQLWSWGGYDNGSNNTVGNSSDAPAIGAGDATTAPIYVSSFGGYLTALNADGGVRWQLDQSGTAAFVTTPTVVETSFQNALGIATPIEELIVPAGALYTVFADPIDGGLTTHTIPLGGSASTSPPLAFGGSAFLGSSDGIFAAYSIVDGGLVDAGAIATDAGSFWEPITDGSDVIVAFAKPSNTGTVATPIYSLNAALTTTNLLGSFQGITAPPALDETGGLFVPTGEHALRTLNIETQGPTPLVSTLAGTGLAPLVGSEGNIYLPMTQYSVLAFRAGLPSWSYVGTRSISTRLMIDCQGILYVGAGNNVFAFVTDDHGLANSAWPNHRRDSRSSGNADAPHYGMATPNGCSQ